MVITSRFFGAHNPGILFRSYAAQRTRNLLSRSRRRVYAASRRDRRLSMVRGTRATMRRNTGSSLGLRATSTHNLERPSKY